MGHRYLYYICVEVIVFFIMLVCGCATIKDVDIIGNYVMVYEIENKYQYIGSEYLTLHADKTFVQHFIDPSGQEKICNGIWELSYSNNTGSPSINMPEYTFHVDVYSCATPVIVHGKLKEGLFAPVRKIGGSVRIYVNDDRGYYFLKQ